MRTPTAQAVGVRLVLICNVIQKHKRAEKFKFLCSFLLTDFLLCAIIKVSYHCEVIMEITKKARQLSVVAFVLYFLLLIWIIALKCNMQNAILDAKIFNRDFTLAERVEMQLGRFSNTDFEDGILNILFFVPLGLTMPFLANKHACVKTVLFCFLISAGFEFLQLFNCIGRFTYIDIINNTIGGITGALMHLWLRPRAKEKPLEVVLIILNVILTVMCIAATANTIVHIEYYL